MCCCPWTCYHRKSHRLHTIFLRHYLSGFGFGTRTARQEDQGEFFPRRRFVPSWNRPVRRPVVHAACARSRSGQAVSGPPIVLSNELSPARANSRPSRGRLGSSGNGYAVFRSPTDENPVRAWSSFREALSQADSSWLVLGDCS